MPEHLEVAQADRKSEQTQCTAGDRSCVGLAAKDEENAHQREDELVRGFDPLALRSGRVESEAGTRYDNPDCRGQP